jgi:hypothetical protein
MKYITFLTTILASPFLIQAMDEPEYKIPQAMISHHESVTNLCNTTLLMLKEFKADDSTSVTKLVNVVSQMQSLKLTCPPISERDMGFFFYKKNPKLNFLDSFKTPFTAVPNNIRVSVFFAHLDQYHSNLGKKVLVSPNKETVFNYLTQQKINGIVAKNALRGLAIPEQTIKELVIPAPSSVGITEFVALTRTIEDFLNDSPEEILYTAKLFYHEELKGNKSPVS